MTPTYHRDGTVTLWNAYTQTWDRARRFSDGVLSSLSPEERSRVLRHTGQRTSDDLTPEIVESLRTEAGQAGDSQMVAICDRWLGGVEAGADVSAILHTLNDAAAQR